MLALWYLIGGASSAYAQAITTLHLHNEVSSINWGYRQLKTTGPDVANVALQTPDLKNQTGDWTLGYFETQTNVPNIPGTIPSGSTVTFKLYMKKTANYGVIYPEVSAWIDHVGGTLLCSKVGTTALSYNVINLFTLSCPTETTVTLAASDRIAVFVGALIGTSTNHSVKAELDLEGTVSPKIYDSRVDVPVPTPTITSLSDTFGPRGWSVTITGTNFGSSPGTVTFNGVTTTPTNWNSNGTSITAPVPAGAPLGAGAVVVTVNGSPNTCPNLNCTFTVVGPPSLTSLTPSTGHYTDAVTIAGTNFMAPQGSSTVTFNGTPGTPTAWTNTSLTVPVPSGATSGNVVVTVANAASNSLPFTVIPPPTLISAYPTSGQPGVSTTVWGTNFGATQGASTLTFNGTAATVTSWTDTRIDASVPSGATTGTVVVTVSNQGSNGVAFTVLGAGTMSGTITRVTGGTGISGATVQAVLTGVVKGSAVTATDGTYSIASLDPGTYDVRISAAGFSTELRQGIVVTSSSSTTVNAAMYAPGSIAGRVTQSDGITPIPGAAVTVFSGATQKGSVNTNGTGDYTIAGLHPGAFTAQAAYAGYHTSEQAATVAENTATTKNFSLDGAAAGPVLYAYDELSRLVQVTNPNGESAIYRYDAVGNITAIERPGASAVAISGFTPISGVVGTTVTIYGAGFSATPSQNAVTFSGTPATVVSATSTQIVTTVPAGAGDGAIAVTVGAATGTSVTAFDVLTSSGAPTITGFNPGTVANGTAFTVSGTNFETVAGNNNLRLNISPAQLTSASATALQTSIPPSATTGRVSVATPNGTAVSSTYLWIAPPPYNVDHIDSTGTLAFATATAVSVPAIADKVALRAVEGTEGQRAAINVTGVTGGNLSVYFYDPFGTPINGGLVSVNGFFDPVDVRSTATYSIVVDPATTNATSATLTVSDVPLDFTAETSFGSAVSVPTNAPGQNALITFPASAGDRVSVTQAGGSGLGCGSSTTSILSPSGATVVSTCSGAFIDRTNALPSSGTYTLRVDPIGATTGSTTVTVYNVPADASGSTTIGGAGVPLTMDTPGQNGFVTFAGTAQQVVSIHVTSSSVGRGTLTLMTEDGQQVVGSTPWLGTGDFNLSNQTLPASATGTYKVVIDPYDANTGTLTVSITSP